MNRKQLLGQIDSLLESHCSECATKERLCRMGVREKQRYLQCIRECKIGRYLQALGSQLVGDESGIGKKWSEGEIFYLVNHIDVLGIERGLRQVAKQLERNESEVEWKYYEETKKTPHMAV